NSANPTPNNIVVVPSANPAYYTSMSEELFIERDINWLRLRDVQLSYELPQGFLGSRNASVFVKGTDLLLITNYTGLDPIVNGNTAAVGGSGGVGIDFGNFPMPRGLNFGIRMAFWSCTDDDALCSSPRSAWRATVISSWPSRPPRTDSSLYRRPYTCST